MNVINEAKEWINSMWPNKPDVVISHETYLIYNLIKEIEKRDKVIEAEIDFDGIQSRNETIDVLHNLLKIAIHNINDDEDDFVIKVKEALSQLED